MASTLGVATVSYAPFVFISILNPIIAIIYGFTGFKIAKMSPEEIAAYEQEKAAIAQEEAGLDVLQFDESNKLV